MLKRILVTFLLLAMLSGVHGQLSKNHKRLFLEAEYNYLIEYYQKALNQFENLLLADPGNSNLNYLCGLCCNSLPGNNTKAIGYLEKAVTDVSPVYREGSYKETKAPPEAYLLLARSYHVANRFSEAIQYYELYRDSTDLSGFSEIEQINHQIKSVELAMSMMEQPQKVAFRDVLDVDSRGGSYRNPVVSADNTVMVYTAEKNENHAIMMTTFQNGKWSNPRRINGELDISGNFSPTCLSPDGQELYLVNMDYYNADIFVAKSAGHRWERAEPLNKNVNSRYNETHASISRDGNYLYFTSDRKGGHGGLDIYRSSLGSDGEWMDAENLGPAINTIYNEATPFLTDLDTKLYFSSEGHQTMGGFDIFRSVLTDDGAWSAPVNIGYPVNTTSDDLFYNPSWDDNTGYYAWRIEDQAATVIKSIEVREQMAAVPKRRNTRDQQGEQEEPDTDVTAAEANNYTTIELQEANTDPAPISLNEHKAGDSRYQILNSILFAYNDHNLSVTARKEVERIYTVMRDMPETTVELAGHSDSKGSSVYNLQLSHKRARSVADYLAELGISRERIKVKALGESAPIAINQYEDGSDAPQGRLLNRYTSIRIHNLPDDRVKVASIMVPENLRPVQDLSYTVILTENDQQIKKMPQTFFGSEISLVKAKHAYLYTSQSFMYKNEAIDMLNKAIDYGFPEAKIMESSRLARYISGESPEASDQEGSFTIQIMALKKDRDVSYFRALGPVMKYTGSDGFNRYTYGIYANQEEADREMKTIRQKGYKNAFVISMEQLDANRIKTESPTIYTENM